MLMDVQRPKVWTKLTLSFLHNVDKILAPEHHHAALSDEEDELVMLRSRQRAELESVDFGVDGGGDVVEGRPLRTR